MLSDVIQAVKALFNLSDAMMWEQFGNRSMSAPLLSLDRETLVQFLSRQIGNGQLMTDEEMGVRRKSYKPSLESSRLRCSTGCVRARSSTTQEKYELPVGWTGLWTLLFHG